MIEKATSELKHPMNFEPFSKEAVLHDYKIGWISRAASLLGRKEVLTGKAKFGIFGDGKEVAQLALSYAFKKGDYRSGYYRDQTLMFALDLVTPESFFAQLYSDTVNDPFSGGRQMNNHYATPFINEKGEWVDQTVVYNVTSDTSNTGGQMARALGLALASKKFKAHKDQSVAKLFSNQGNEVCFCTIGDASTSEGVFWETFNAAGVMKVPLAIFVWDDGYGISVPKEYQTTKASISEALSGFQMNDAGEGAYIFKGKGWDYPSLIQLFTHGIEQVRSEHVPALFHIDEITQPQGHSTSGSHERYKSKDRLKWEREHDCLRMMESWMINEGYATQEECQQIQSEAKKLVRAARDRAWKAHTEYTKGITKKLRKIYQDIPGQVSVKQELDKLIAPTTSEILANGRRMYFNLLGSEHRKAKELKSWVEEVRQTGDKKYERFLYSESPFAAIDQPVIPPVFSEASPSKNGYQILNEYFDILLGKDPRVFAFGEDVGQIGDVNQGFAGLQKKYGEHRVFDTGIREWTIIGQAIGMAMRGLRPIAEIQYLDYLIYGLEPLTDDLATLRWRTNNIQQAPAIIRSRGHRLEGIWHSGSPMGMIINALRGIYICVPRNMTQAAGMYNTLINSDDPALVIECLNGYRLKEKRPDNIGEYTVPLGIPEILNEGTDVTVVTYGSCVRVALKGIELLKKVGISVELIDVQTLIPFDRNQSIINSLKKTNRVVFLDEDVPGGASAYMMKKVLEDQDGYYHLDSKPVTLTAKAHRPPYGSDGDYFSKPNPEDVFEVIYKLIYEANPNRFAGNL